MANKVQLPSKQQMLAAWEEVKAKGAESIPRARGWRMLVMMPALPEKTAGGVILTDNYVQQEEIACPVGLVVDMGPLCYSDRRKFSDGQPWCEIGDVVVFRSYSGTRLVIHGKEFRSISDEAVEQIVDDPRGIERI